MSVGTWMEGIADSYVLSKRENNKQKMIKYRNAINIGIRNLYLLQVDSNNNTINNGSEVI